MSNLSEKLDMIDNLKKDYEFQHLLNESCKILGNPIVMFDTDYHLIANTEGVATDDRFWNEIVTSGTFSMESLEFFRDAGFIEDIANARVITFMVSEKLEYDRIYGKIFNNNNIHVASLIMIACYKPFEPEDAAAFEAMCDLLSGKISSSKYYHDYEGKYQESLICKLIEGGIVDKELYAARISILYGGLKTNLYVAVFDFAKCDPKHKKLSYFKDLFWKAQPAFKYAIYSNYIVVIISTDNTTFDIKKDLGKLYGILKRKGIQAGISGCFENIYELSTYYNYAVEALNERRLII